MYTGIFYTDCTDTDTEFEEYYKVWNINGMLKGAVIYVPNHKSS